MLRKDRTRPKRKANRTRTHPNGPTPIEVKDYRHKGEKRKNIPDAGLATYNYKPLGRAKYSYDPHLDPQLIWTGKLEHPSFEVETVSLHIHERVSTQAILSSLGRAEQFRQLKLFADPDLPFDKRIEFYEHEMDWTNRLILGDSLHVMNSLLERELMAGKVQMIYVDPPYGIAYSSNFQPYVTKRDVRNGEDESLTREVEQIKAYRDTWELGIHSYLTYLKERLLLCKKLLHESGSIFVQISSENLHHVRELMDEVFENKNFCGIIPFIKTTGQTTKLLAPVCDYLVWYARNKESVKFHQLYVDRPLENLASGNYRWVESPKGERRPLTANELRNPSLIPPGWKPYALSGTSSQTKGSGVPPEFSFQGKKFRPEGSRGWSTTMEGLQRLEKANRLVALGNTLRYVRYYDDFPLQPLRGLWMDTGISGFASDKLFVVQTNVKVVERCILMTTDAGDLALDPTCGSGTTAFCAEKWGRRWITGDTSRVALALTRMRLMTAQFDWYKLANPERGVDGGFCHESVPHVTLKSIAQNETPHQETLFNKPIVERDKVRVSGPFTVEAIPVPVVREDSAQQTASASSSMLEGYADLTIELLRKSGITFPGGKQMVLENLRPTSSAGFVHAEGEATQNGDKVRVAVSLGPRYGPVTAKQVDEAIRSSYKMGFDVLVFAGFAFDPEAQATIQKNPIPKLRVQMAHISPDVIVGAYSDSPLLKTTKTSQLFTVFGEPDVKLEKNKDGFIVRLRGVDLYDPTTGEVHSSNADEIPAWFLDEDYDGYTFRICQAFFPKEATAKNPWDKLGNALRGLVDKEKMEKFRGTESLPFKGRPQQQVSVKVIDIRGNEVMAVRSLGEKEQI